MGRPKKDDDSELAKLLEKRKKALVQKYREDLILADKCFEKNSDIKCFLWFKGYEYALDTFNKELEKTFSSKD